MTIQLRHHHQTYVGDLSHPIDLSIELGRVKCFYATDFAVTPYRSGDFIGSVKAGAPVNFFDVQLNPHGNGTHTECLGHITAAQESVNAQLRQFHFVAQVVSVPITTWAAGDRVITEAALREACPAALPEALILRTLPNSADKLTMDYSGTNPPYLLADAMAYLAEQGVQHLLIDLPSVDREEDDGKLVGHHLFFGLQSSKASPAAASNQQSRAHCTITELIFVPDSVADGLYLLNLQFPAMPLDAAPSRPVIYPLQYAE